MNVLNHNFCSSSSSSEFDVPPITASYVYYFDHNQSVLGFSHCLHTLSFNFFSALNSKAMAQTLLFTMLHAYPVILKMGWKIQTELRSAQFKLAWIISGLNSRPTYPSIHAHMLIRITYWFNQRINVNTTFHSLQSLWPIVMSVCVLLLRFYAVMPASHIYCAYCACVCQCPSPLP